MPGGHARIADLLPSWQLSLTERELSPKTIEVYIRTGTQFTAWLAGQALPDDTEGVEAAHIRAFLAAETARTSAVSSHQHYRNLRVLFKWLAREDERQAPNPMERVDEPKVTKKVKGVLTTGQLAALLKTCEGQTFEARRDMAIIRVFIDTGVRVSGLGNATAAGVSLSAKTIRVVLKGGDEHLVPVGRKAAAALDRYVRIRARHRHASSPWLWLGMAGRDPGHFGAAGIQDMLERRGKMIGAGKLTPHAFRRTFAHDWLASGGSELDGMSIAGWKTRAMMDMYAGELAGDRARTAHARLAPGDRI
ncbi:MAG: integrase family protein [Streptosporangiaceae bacterium]|nr:integrase family protein [Streptosporangiaceae bacterium]